MDAFITKPVDAAVLYKTLSGLVSGEAPAQPAALKAIEGTPAPQDSEMLNAARLESFIRIGMLDELLGDYLPEIAALVGKMQRHVQQKDFQACSEALHSLLGMSGEAGATALYQAVRRAYVPMVETGQWPVRPDWAGEIAALAARTEFALKAYRAAHKDANLT
jgi:two-component system CAI-1 autoinducer sensor kinase/phosphatase CqsS